MDTLRQSRSLLSTRSCFLLLLFVIQLLLSDKYHLLDHQVLYYNEVIELLTYYEYDKHRLCSFIHLLVVGIYMINNDNVNKNDVVVDFQPYEQDIRKIFLQYDSSRLHEVCFDYIHMSEYVNY